jgi:hypothetical protein
MTEEEADALDEKFTKNTYMPEPNGTGAWSRRLKKDNIAHMVPIDTFSAKYLMTKAMSSHITPTEVISDMIRKELAAGTV